MIRPNSQIIFLDARRHPVVGRVIKGPDQVGQYAVEYGLGRWWTFLREHQMTPAPMVDTLLADPPDYWINRLLLEAKRRFPEENPSVMVDILAEAHPKPGLAPLAYYRWLCEGQASGRLDWRAKRPERTPITEDDLNFEPEGPQASAEIAEDALAGGGDEFYISEGGSK